MKNINPEKFIEDLVNAIENAGGDIEVKRIEVKDKKKKSSDLDESQFTPEALERVKELEECENGSELANKMTVNELLYIQGKILSDVIGELEQVNKNLDHLIACFTE